MERQTGWTLLELLIGMAIMMILGGFGTRAVQDTWARVQADSMARDLVVAVRIARQASRRERVPVTLCPGTEADGCSTNWGMGLILFTDINGNGDREAGEPIVHRVAPAIANSRLSWRAFRGKAWLQMTPSGWTASQNGSFVYCPADNDARHARVVVVSKAGRPRIARDEDGDGVVEMASGKPVSCGPAG